MASIRFLNELFRSDLPVAGGKGANLGEMSQAGLPVPDGFVVLTSAYRDFIEDNGLQAEIRTILEGLASGSSAAGTAGSATSADTAAVDQASAAIRARIERGTISPLTAGRIASAYRELGGGPVAVRSSATAEDLPDASFAGQQDTYLNIEGAEQVLDHVRRAWGSLWTARAITYRLRQGIAAEGLAIAVVVQRLVPAQAAGVLFTANPLNNRYDQMLVNGAWGLGEAVVGGEVTPDQWVLRGETGEVVEAQIAAKQVMTVREVSGSATRETPAALREQPALADSQLSELAALGRRAADLFGAPQDIEWAWDGERFHLLQSRPITSLLPIPEPLPSPGQSEPRIYVSVNLVTQNMTEPFTPMGIEYFRAMLGGFVFLATGHLTRYPWWFKVSAGRIYEDITEILRDPKRWSRITRQLANKDPIGGAALTALIEREREALVDPARARLKIPLRLVPTLLGNLLLAALAPRRARHKLLSLAETTLGRLESGASRLQGVTDRLDFIEEVVGPQVASLITRQGALAGPGMATMLEQLQTVVSGWAGEPSAFGPLLRALPHNPTTEMGIALWRLSRELRSQGVEPTADHPGVQEFLQRYGHRTIREIDMGLPRWSESPDYILGMLRTYIGQEDSPASEEQFTRHREAARQAADALVARVRRNRGPFKALHTRLLTRYMEELAGLRERPKFDLVRAAALTRRIIRQVGEELVREGRLAAAEDVFFLTFADIRGGGDLRAKAGSNRLTYGREMGRRQVPRLMTSLGEAIYGGSEQPVSGALTGIVASPGVYEGTVRVVHDPVGARLEPGEVLVARTTDPAWTPLFLSAGALVMEVGGTVSHGAVVAREYGLPAVIGVAGATEQLKDGQRVRVDANRGQVVVL